MSEKVVIVKELVKMFGTFAAVDRISFEVDRGEIFGFLGANGAGKTTAIKILTGLLEPSSGKAVVAGYDVAVEPDLVKRGIGYMSQRFSLYQDLTVSENITFFGGIYGLSDQRLKEKRDHLIDKLGLSSVRKRMVSTLPLGWKQKLAFALARIHDPEIIFLDEPTGGVDPVTRREFWEQIYEVADEGTTVFVTTHYMDEAEYCDRISIMVDGRIEALGSPTELREYYNAQNMEEVFFKLAGMPEKEGS